MVKNQIVTITIEDIGNDGEGIGKYEGYTLFVKGAVVGDVAKVKVLKAKKTYGYAKVEELLSPSPDRGTKMSGSRQMRRVSVAAFIL